MKLPDLPPRSDPKGGSPKTPPGGIPRRYVRTFHTDRPERDPGVGYVELREFFTLWLERLEVFYERRFEDLESKTTLALANADKAGDKAEASTEKRFESVNEFRSALSDQAAQFITRPECEGKHLSLMKDIARLDKELQALREAESGVTGQQLQRDQTRQDVSAKQSWLVPMLIIGGIAVINLIVNLVFTLKPH